MRLKSLLVPLAMAVFTGLAAPSVLAGPSGYPVQAPPQGIYTAGTVLVRIGAAYIEPDNKDVYEGTQSFLVEDPSGDVVGEVPVDVFTRVNLDDDTTWYISGVWLPIEHFGLELYFAADGSHDASLFSSARSEGAFVGDFSTGISDFDSYTTSLYANWYPMDPTCLIQPYVGIGVSYVDFEDEFIRPVFRAFGEEFGVLRLGSDFNWSAQVGVDFNFGRDNGWLINLSAMYVKSDPSLELGYDTTTQPAGFGESVVLPVRIRSDLDFDPWIINLGVGYRFSF
ncbi:OmpW/AlkL family protein [Microbulbifer thermotolerans]|nr:OmpW family outer membrane protein [Microbulbifer thermotolerans]MCX2780032.1 hypothetical protein [Microbulbifer thermotolerans]MCX2781771.1 hypothetical protein [Microbulbifer thermotolerans]MCX2795112.1 hypothetical protein [Microbulbifer thermotolerans]MCX2801859.1 hypothetical protein [Microbulbifer thermotolerans]MCX2805455.1 hypothetical protein [Microbulbifer thermotolerans]